MVNLRPFWPDLPGQSLLFEAGYQKMKVTLLDVVDTAAWKTGPNMWRTERSIRRVLLPMLVEKP